MNKRSTVFDCVIMDLPQVHNVAGNITAIENEKNIPFSVKRIYYLYDVPGGKERGAHAHKTLHQYVVAASGSFDVILDDGLNRKTVTLNHPNRALYLVPGIWRELSNFSSGAICLVLASDVYNRDDYVRSYQEFIKVKNDTPTS